MDVVGVCKLFHYLMEELYQYDPRNRLTGYTKGGATTQFTYDKAGNLLKDDKARYFYDAFNRTEKVETFDGHVVVVKLFCNTCG